jgi:hypothetical protein
MFATYKEQYNQAFLAYFGYTARLVFQDLICLKDLSYNSGLAAVKVTQKIFIGLSVSDLASGKVETTALRKLFQHFIKIWVFRFFKSGLRHQYQVTVLRFVL